MSANCWDVIRSKVTFVSYICFWTQNLTPELKLAELLRLTCTVYVCYSPLNSMTITKTTDSPRPLGFHKKKENGFSVPALATDT